MSIIPCFRSVVVEFNISKLSSYVKLNLGEFHHFFVDMIDQILLLHPSIPYLHMGCDEVYYRLVHPQCVNLDFRDDADLFIR
jgi:hypothetical protein